MPIDDQPLITKRRDGEYSTVRIGSHMIETMWFGNDGTALIIGRTSMGLDTIAKSHIAEWEKAND